MNTPNTQVSAAPSPHDDPVGQNGTPLQRSEQDEIFAVLQGGAQPRQQDNGQSQTPSPPVTQPAPGTPPAQVNLTPSHQAPQMQPQVVPPGTPPGNPATPAPGAQTADLAPILQRLTTVLERPAAPAGAPAQPQTPAYAQVPDYGYNIPDQVMQGLSSEDPAIAKQALGTIATGISRHVHQTVLSMTRQMIQQSLIPHMKQEMESAIAAAEIFRDFYGDYKDLNDNAFRPMIVAEAQRLAQTHGANFAYGPQFKQQLAAAIYAKLGRQMPGAQAPQGQPQAQYTPPAPPGMVGGGNGGRPMGGSTQGTMQDEIAELVNYRG